MGLSLILASNVHLAGKQNYMAAVAIIYSGFIQIEREMVSEIAQLAIFPFDV